MNFRTNYRPKLPRNKYGALTKNHLSRYTSNAATFNLRNTTAEKEVIHYEMLKSAITFSDEEMEFIEGTKPEEPADIIIETE